jgi:REP element-mobilizing transposase RayT
MWYSVRVPSRNVLKIDVDDCYFHVYARGVNRRTIFEAPEDFGVFLNLLKRYLSAQPARDSSGRLYPHLYGKVELLCYCLMDNHFHMLLYQQKAGAMPQLMRGVMTSYSRYFNATYSRSGPLFESRYKGSMVDNDAYLEHISRYIHLNPGSWRIYPYSSLAYFTGALHADWLRPERVLSMFGSAGDYLNFLRDYEGQKHILEDLKNQLAAV